MSRKVPFSSRKSTILVLLCITWVINYFDKIVINIAAIPIAKEFNLSESQVGLIISSFFLSYALMQPVGGWLSDKLGSRKVILISAIFWSFFTLFTGFAWSLLSLLIIRFLFGIGEGSYPTASTVAIAETFPQKQRARAKSALTASMTIGTVISSALSGLLIEAIGWRPTFILLGVLGVILSIVLFFSLKPPGSTDIKEEKVQEPKVPMKEWMSKPIIWQLMFIYFGSSILNWGMNSWMPSYLVNERGISLGNAGLLTSIAGAIGLVAVIVLGVLLDKKSFEYKEKYIIMAGALTAAFCIYLMVNTSSITALVVYQCLAAVGMLCVTTPALTIPLKYIDKKMLGRAMGVVYFGGQTAGIIAPSLMGYMIEVSGGSYKAAFSVIIVAILISFTAGMTIRKKHLNGGVSKEKIESTDMEAETQSAH